MPNTHTENAKFFSPDTDTYCKYKNESIDLNRRYARIKSSRLLTSA